jgi:N utilization substance protein A
MNSEFFTALDMIEKEKGIPKEYMLERVEAALLSAFKRDYGACDNAKVVLDPERKEVRMFMQKEVVENIEDDYIQITLEDARAIDKRYNIGDTVDIEIKTNNFGRISAQTAKQVIIQGIREAERGLIYQEFMSSEHEILNCIVQKVDTKTRNATLEIGKTEMVLVNSEQIPGEVLKEGDRIKVYVVEVRKIAKGPQVMISRTHPGLVRRLFELEIPEIADGVVEIMSVAREAGSRTKIAVLSKDESVDPIGACIGPKGIRVGNIVNELKGEKIDIVKYSDNPEEYIASALSPSDVVSVTILSEGKGCRVIVPDDQLSLAIGKEGQNARLAAKLTGWKIDIKSELMAEQE